MNYCASLLVIGRFILCNKPIISFVRLVFDLVRDRAEQEKPSCRFNISDFATI